MRSFVNIFSVLMIGSFFAMDASAFNISPDQVTIDNAKEAFREREDAMMEMGVDFDDIKQYRDMFYHKKWREDSGKLRPQAKEMIAGLLLMMEGEINNSLSMHNNNVQTVDANGVLVTSSNASSDNAASVDAASSQTSWLDELKRIVSNKDFSQTVSNIEKAKQEKIAKMREQLHQDPDAVRQKLWNNRDFSAGVSKLDKKMNEHQREMLKKQIEFKELTMLVESIGKQLPGPRNAKFLSSVRNNIYDINNMIKIHKGVVAGESEKNLGGMLLYMISKNVTLFEDLEFLRTIKNDLAAIAKELNITIDNSLMAKMDQNNK